jgi:hypothetical protein
MITLTANHQMQQFLASVKETAEIRDTKGKLLGHFTPSLGISEVDARAIAAKLFDPEEMRRRARDEHGKGFTFDQVMEHVAEP